MALTAYKVVLGQSKEETERGFIDERVATAQSTVDLEIATLNEAVAQAVHQVSVAASSFPLNITAIRNAMNARDLKNRELAQVKQIRSELFPTS